MSPKRCANIQTAEASAKEEDSGEDRSINIEELQFPSDWCLGPIASCFDFTTKPRGLDLSKNGDHIPFFPMDQIPLGRIHASEFTPKPLSQLGSGTYVENGDLMVAKITPSFENGKQAIVDIETDFAYATTEVIPMRGRGGVSDTLFLFFYLLHPEVRSDLAGKMEGSTGRQRLSKTVLGDRLIPLPPLAEQKKIAHILSTVQRAIEAQERIIQTTTELKKALMHKLFTEGLRNEPQKQTEIGPVPESWEVVELGEIARIERGKFSHRPRNEPRFYGGEYPFVQTGDVSNCDGYVRSYTQTLNEEGLAISKMFPAGTILITIAANIGFTGILEFDSACPDSLIGISPDENVNTEFLNYYLISQQPHMDRLAPKGTQKNINIQFLKPWPVPLPSFEEQLGIAEAFSETDRKIRLATQKRTQLQDLFRILLHELMTAKTPVHELELSV
ncbi:MAG: restriction endonuclease subunit S [Wenzhouxiangella sp.]